MLRRKPSERCGGARRVIRGVAAEARRERYADVFRCCRLYCDISRLAGYMPPPHHPTAPFSLFRQTPIRRGGACAPMAEFLAEARSSRFERDARPVCLPPCEEVHMRRRCRRCRYERPERRRLPRRYAREPREQMFMLFFLFSSLPSLFLLPLLQNARARFRRHAARRRCRRCRGVRVRSPARRRAAVRAWRAAMRASETSTAARRQRHAKIYA